MGEGRDLAEVAVTPEDRWGAPLPIGRLELFLGFFKIGALGFGGVAPGARRVIVEERRWLSDAEYASVLAVGQALPGANTVNAAVMIGDRAQGPLGSVIALCGLFLAPLALLLVAAVLYRRYGEVAQVRGALNAAGSAAAGLVAGTAIKMLMGLNLGRQALVFALVTFVAVGLFRMPLLAALFVLGGISVAAAWRRIKG